MAGHFDFLMPSGEALELKTDTYNMDKTENFLSNDGATTIKTAGGPYQAFGRGATIFAYLYIKMALAFFFNTIDLIRHIDKVEKGQQNKKPVYIRNHGWTTTGYKISRKDVEHLVVDIKNVPILESGQILGQKSANAVRDYGNVSTKVQHCGAITLIFLTVYCLFFLCVLVKHPCSTAFTPIGTVYGLQ